jgi:RHO1 GDP-GTP exchange protein 1/2
VISFHNIGAWLIYLSAILKVDFRSAYTVYIKHYPLAEPHHRKELERNQAYESFVQSVSNDPRMRKRDLITFFSRPVTQLVTRLSRLNLLLSLEQTLKLTYKGYEHLDLETLPTILGILCDYIKSTQPGIEAAETKVKLWALYESLVFQKGEIMVREL